MTVQAIPEGYNTVNPYLVVRGAAKAIDFYTRALGAVERYRMPAPDGSIAHAEIQIGDSVVMVADENPDMGAVSPQALGGSPVNLLVYTEDVDAAFARAVEAGATATAEPADMFWGDRYGRLLDPFGHDWSLATHVEDVDPEEMARRMEAMAAENA